MNKRVLVCGAGELYQSAADMGGAGYVFTGEHDAAIMRNSALINLNVVQFRTARRVPKFFYSSPARIYPAQNQTVRRLLMKL